jgi:hypothetical protein
VVCRLDFEEDRAAFVPPTLFFEDAFLAWTLRAGRGFRATVFFTELFFFFGFAIAVSAL